MDVLLRFKNTAGVRAYLTAEQEAAGTHLRFALIDRDRGVRGDRDLGVESDPRDVDTLTDALREELLASGFADDGPPLPPLLTLVHRASGVRLQVTAAPIDGQHFDGAVRITRRDGQCTALRGRRSTFDQVIAVIDEVRRQGTRDGWEEESEDGAHQ